jgi:hypothetical protein
MAVNQGGFSSNRAEHLIELHVSRCVNLRQNASVSQVAFRRRVIPARSYTSYAEVIDHAEVFFTPGWRCSAGFYAVPHLDASIVRTK